MTTEDKLKTYKEGYRDGFADGYEQAKKELVKIQTYPLYEDKAYTGQIGATGSYSMTMNDYPTGANGPAGY